LVVGFQFSGQRSAETFKRRAVQSSYKCGEPEGGGNTIKVPVSSVSTCISSNTLLKASEGRTVRSFLSDDGSSLRSDVDELKEELAALRHRLAAEEEEAKRLREEVWCFVLDVSYKATYHFWINYTA
jgi:hypothetical protein